MLLFSCNSEENNSIQMKRTKESLGFVILKGYPITQCKGTQPELTLRENGNALLLITKVAPFEDSKQDFPGGLELQKLIESYVGIPLIKKAGEVFIIENATEENCLKTVEFFANY